MEERVGEEKGKVKRCEKKGNVSRKEVQGEDAGTNPSLIQQRNSLNFVYFRCYMGCVSCSKTEC